jgi:hypothetical protein
VCLVSDGPDATGIREIPFVRVMAAVAVLVVIAIAAAPRPTRQANGGDRDN